MEGKIGYGGLQKRKHLVKIVENFDDHLFQKLINDFLTDLPGTALLIDIKYLVVVREDEDEFYSAMIIYSDLVKEEEDENN